MMRLWFVCVLSAAHLFALCQEKLDGQHYKIFSVKKNKEVALTELVADMDHFDILLFGEEHNDSVAHHLQKEILELFYNRFGSRTILSLEMFERDVQSVMDEYLNGMIRDRNLIKDARAWPNYRDYKPMVEFARDNKLRVVCANAPGRYTNLAGRKGPHALNAVSPYSRKYFAPLPYDTASGGYHKKLMDLQASHSQVVTPDSVKSARSDSTKSMVETAVKISVSDSTKTMETDSTKATAPVTRPTDSFSMVAAQSLWDATMAFSIAEAFKKNKTGKVYHVNGRFHSDERYGVYTQLMKYVPKKRIMVLSCSPEKSFPDIEWDNFKYRGDYIIITDPEIPRTFKTR
jgi:uncharacterized iron-regulated protein